MTRNAKRDISRYIQLGRRRRISTAVDILLKIQVKMKTAEPEQFMVKYMIKKYRISTTEKIYHVVIINYL